jgi:hypothetical protein
MADHAYNVPGGYSYHHCAALEITVPLAAEGKGNLALTVELKTAIVELALQQHVAEDVAQLLVAQTVTLEAARS